MNSLFLRVIPSLLALSAFASQVSPVVSTGLQKRLVPEDTWWICRDFRRRANPSDVVSYYSTDVQAAVNAGYRHHAESVGIYSHNHNVYPHPFGNYDNMNLDVRCDPDRLVEYPILLNGIFGDGDDEGLDRVVFDGVSGTFCGVITHRGHGDRTFHRCLQHNTPIGDHPRTSLEIPTIPELPWMAGIGEGSGLNPKSKRTGTPGFEDERSRSTLDRRDDPLPLPPTELLPEMACADDLACNAPGCWGENNAGNSSTGICRGGICSGLSCKNICKDTQSCSADGCNGRADPTGKTGKCVDGEYAGCSCTPSCDDASHQDCKACGGTSFTNGTGVCGSGDHHGCPCHSSCGPPVDCSQQDCLGLNNPGGDLGVCMGAYRGCSCRSVCQPTKCNANGCQGFNNQTSTGDNQPGICTAGSLLGCRCDSVCPKDLRCDDGPSQCNGLNQGTGGGTCTAGDYLGCACKNVCPSPPLQCTDTACLGHNGRCQGEGHWGCNCDGPAATVDLSTPITSSPPTQTLECTNPSLEDGNGLCTCWIGKQTVGTYSPTSGNCPTAKPTKR